MTLQITTSIHGDRFVAEALQKGVGKWFRATGETSYEAIGKLISGMAVGYSRLVDISLVQYRGPVFIDGRTEYGIVDCDALLACPRAPVPPEVRFGTVQG